MWVCVCVWGTPLQTDENGMAREVRRRCVLVLLLLLLLSLLCVRAGAGDSADDDCVACRYTFGYSYEFFAGHHVEVRNTPDRRYFPTHGLWSLSFCEGVVTMWHTHAFTHTQG